MYKRQVLSLAVGVKKDLPVTELLKTDIFVDWVEIYNEKSGIQGGMAVSKAVLHDSDKNRREMDDAELKRDCLLYTSTAASERFERNKLPEILKNSCRRVRIKWKLNNAEKKTQSRPVVRAQLP